MRKTATEGRNEHFKNKGRAHLPMQAWPLATACPPAETFRGPRGLRKGVVQDLERLYRLRREAILGEGLTQCGSFKEQRLTAASLKRYPGQT